MTADIKDFYLGTTLPEPEFLRIQMKHLPEEAIRELNLQSFIHNGCILLKVVKGMYGHPVASRSWSST